jgi:hypothetical protein
MNGEAAQESPGVPDFASLRQRAYAKSPGESVWIPKSELPTLPPQFSRTTLGTPLFLAHPGSTAQYRATPALHAYEKEEGWALHRDRYDPEENPAAHAVFDAPEVVLAGLAAAFAGFVTYYLLDARESEKPEDERRWWFPAAWALLAALLAGAAVYFLGALVRVALGVG